MKLSFGNNEPFLRGTMAGHKVNYSEFFKRKIEEKATNSLTQESFYYKIIISVSASYTTQTTYRGAGSPKRAQ